MKRNTVRRILVGLFSAAIVLSTAACGSTATSDSAATAKEETTTEETEPAEEGGSTVYATTYGDKVFDDVTITYAIYDMGVSGPNGETIADNKWVDYINEEMGKVGITVEVVPIPVDGYDEKIQSMLATGTAPDLIGIWNSTMMEQMYNDGGLWRLNEFIDDDSEAVNLRKYLTDDVIYSDPFVTNDGSLFALTNKRNETQVFNTYVRQDWLDELGLEDPTTYEEFYNMLVAFKEAHPDCIPYFPCYTDTLLGQMVYTFSETAAESNEAWLANSFAGIYKDDGIVEYFRQMNKMYHEGLLDPEFFVHTTDIANEFMYELILTGRVGCFAMNVCGGLYPPYGRLIQNAEKNNPGVKYDSMIPIKNEVSGEVVQVSYDPFGMTLVIPKTSKNPEAAITLLDWFTTPAGEVLLHGYEGEHFEYDENGLMVPTDNFEDVNWQQSVYNVMAQYSLDPDNYMSMKAASYGEYADLCKKNLEDAAAGKHITFNAHQGEKQLEVSADLSAIKDEYNVKLITCDPADFDGLVEEYRQKLADVGAEEIWAENMAYYGLQ